MPIQMVLAAGNEGVAAIKNKVTEVSQLTAPGKVGVANLKLSKSILHFSNAATDLEIENERVFLEPLVPMTGVIVPLENQALVSALSAFAAGKDPEKLGDLTGFLSKYPKSRWAASLNLNLGLLRDQTGYMTDALKYYRAAWDEAKVEKGRAQRGIADRAFGELSMAYARVGRKAELEKLMAETAGRIFRGSVAERAKAARYNLYKMQNVASDAFTCGPYAVASLPALKGADSAALAIVKSVKSTEKGTNLSQLKTLTERLGLNYQAAKRSPGAKVIVPAIFHWKLGHYAALIAQQKGKYYLKDPTYDTAGNTALSLKALEVESDGFFLVPAGPLPDGWRAATVQETDNVWGKADANTAGKERSCATPQLNASVANYSCKTCFGGKGICDPPKEEGCGCGMAQASVYEMQATLHIQDAPTSYKPPIGPEIGILANYNQNEADQPSGFTFTNLTTDWSFNWCSYLTVDASQNVTVRVRGGGTETYAYVPPSDDFSSPYAPNQYTQARIAQAGGGAYQRLLPDGSKEIFGLADTTVSPTMYYMTQVVDPQGNAASIAYSGHRVTNITDAIGQTSTLTYVSNVVSNSGYYLISSIADPFGRSCSFAYDSNNSYLMSITDCVGMKSQFIYGVTSGAVTSSYINLLTTPYGSTSFYNYDPDGSPFSNGMRLIYPDGTSSVVESWLAGTKNSYIWDREAVMSYPSDPANRDYSHCETIHWLVYQQGVGSMAAVMANDKKALETLITYSYPDQPPNPIPGAPSEEVGSMNKPSQISQPLEAGLTKNELFKYNELGQITNYIDPVQRQYSYLYSANNIDLLEMRGTTAGANDLLGKWEYNSQHLVLVSIDGSAQRTQSTYNPFGQITSLTDSNGNTTTYSYTGYYLHTIDGPLAGSSDLTTYTFDSVGRILSITDSVGYIETFSYDAMDRLVKTTFPDSTSASITWYRLDPVVMRDRRGRVTQNSFDNMGQKISEIDSLGRITKYSWCACGALRKLTDGNGNVTTWSHDLQGRVLQKVYPNPSKVVDFTYENDGRLHSITDSLSPQRQTKTFTYNLDDTISQIAYTNTLNPIADRFFTYDTNYNRLKSATTSDFGSMSFAYKAFVNDPFGSSITGGGALSTITISPTTLTPTVIDFSYDSLGRLTNRSVNGLANNSMWTYDAASRLTSETNNLGAFNYNYVNPTLGSTQLSSVVYPVGSPNNQKSSFSWYTSSTPTQFEQLQQISNSGPGVSPPNLSQYGYQYDSESNITQWTQKVAAGATNTVTAAYDQCDQLLSATGLPTGSDLYQYDAASNRTQYTHAGTPTTATINNLNQIVALTGGTTAPIDYDGNGNLTSDGTNNYSWDAENRLIQVTYPGLGNSSKFSYDPLGGLVRIVETMGGAVTSTKNFIRTTKHVLEERDAINAVQKRFFAQGQTNGAVNFFYTFDHLGSVRDVTDSSGIILAHYEYDMYGNALRTVGSVHSDFQYAGYYFHAPSGLSLSLTRPYSAFLGRWLGRDPLGESAGSNLYQYLDNNPLAGSDEFGLSPTFPRGKWIKVGRVKYWLPTGYKDAGKRHIYVNHILTRCFGRTPKSQFNSQAWDLVEKGIRLTLFRPDLIQTFTTKDDNSSRCHVKRVFSAYLRLVRSSEPYINHPIGITQTGAPSYSMVVAVWYDDDGTPVILSAYPE